RTSPLPAEDADADPDADRSSGTDRPSGTGTDGPAGRPPGTGDGSAAAEDAAGTDHPSDAAADTDADAAADTDVDGDGEGLVDGGPAWSRALRRRVSEVFDPAVADNGAGSLGVGVGVLAGMRGGADLAAVLARTDAATLDRVAGIEVLAAHRRVAAWAAGRAAVTAARLSHAARFFDHPRLAEPVDVTAEEIAMRLAVSRQEARKLVRVGEGLTRRFRDTAAALEAGVVDYPKAAAIVTTLAGSPVQVAVQVEAQVLEEADGRTVAQVRRDLTRALVEVDPQDAQDRRVRARARRHVNHTRVLPDGMGSIYAVLPAEDCVQVDLTLDAIAHGARNDGDARTIDQLRADALLALTHAALIAGTTGPPDTPDATDTGVPGVPGVPGVRSVVSPSAASPPGPADAIGTVPTGATGTGAGCAPPGDAPSADERAGGGDRLDSPAPAGAGGSACSGAGTGASPPAAPPGGVPGTAGPPVGVEFPPLHELLLRSRERFTVPDIRVHVTVPLATTLPPEPPDGPEGTALPTRSDDGADGADGGVGAGSGAGEEVGGEPVPAAYLEGYGPITPDLARALAAGGTWRRLVTDPVTGTVTHLGRSVYRPPAALQALVRARDVTCVRPACTHLARRAQIDHTKAWSAGGTTDLDQLGT
ncbi:13E12 repeat family protein, partial [Georgenia sp. EYE_87]|uniref:DUF222 domain-containing protein n=1 Tax=Georgenia sp. EYE_87 TaxID=2853448 RepID=UPI0020051CC0